MKSRDKLRGNSLVLLMVMVVFSGSLFAQSLNATLVGKVTDSNGAVVPGADVTITQNGTNRTQSAKSNEDGEYQISQMPPGVYTIKITMAGFKISISEKLVLETDTTSRFNVTLETGGVNETVTITSEPSVINTETSEKGEVITPKQVQDLPLNGRDFQDLALLVPGVYPRPDVNDSGKGVSASGSRTDSTNFILDGITNRVDRSGAVGVNTSVDSIQEFKVSTSNYSAEFGRVGGAQISVVTKSGTNRFSGTAFEYVRNDFFDAIDVFATPEDGKKLRRNQFGGTLGGPLPFFNFGEGGPVFTKGTDRTFFFTSYEKTKEIRSINTLTTAPNAAWLTGDFRNVRGPGTDGILGNSNDTNRVLCLSRNAATLVVTKVECPVQNVIPFAVNPLFPTILAANPVSLQILQRLPAANVAGTLSVYRATGTSNINRDQFVFKVDHRLANNNNLSIRYSQDNNADYDPLPSDNNFPGFGRKTGADNKSVAISDIHTFSSNIINEFRFGYLTSHNATRGDNQDKDYVSLFGIPGLPSSSNPTYQGFPAVTVDGFAEFGDRPNEPFIYDFNNLQFYNILTAIVGDHSFRFGADLLIPKYTEADATGTRGTFRFRGRTTNPSGGTGSGFYSFADFLYGLPDSVKRQIGTDPVHLSNLQSAFFVQDDWRIAPWLTLNLGLRYDHTPPLKERDNKLSNFLPSLGGNVCSSGEFRDPVTNALICVSAASQGLPDTLIKTDTNNWGPRLGFALRPFKNDKTVIRGGAGIFYGLETINPARKQLTINYPYVLREQYSRLAANLTLLSWQNPFPAGRGQTEGVLQTKGLPTNTEAPEIYQFHLTVAHQLAKDLALEVGYVGTLGRKLGITYDLHQAYPIALVGTTLTTVRAFPLLETVDYQIPAGNSNYHGLQASLRRRAANGLTLLLSYTFSRSLDVISTTNNNTTGSQIAPQDIRNFRADYGLSDNHRAHQFSGSFNYTLPFGQGKRFFGDSSGFANAILGGWQLNGIVSFLSGRPYTPQFETPTAGSRQRPDLIGDPTQNIPAGFDFNPFAFALPAATTADPNLFGNSGRNILIGRNFSKTDLSLFKVVQLKERMSLQLRWEVFNAFNHANFKIPTFKLPSNISAVGSTPAITLDQLRSTTNAGRPVELTTPMREMQFAVRLIF